MSLDLGGCLLDLFLALGLLDLGFLMACWMCVEFHHLNLLVIRGLLVCISDAGSFSGLLLGLPDAGWYFWIGWV